ncbi:MAG: thiosulfate sulfurtransferase GlpE [Gammaproteobacteria bacterium]|nr:MAG: thiosulfate sulfurtransferase GlpE [Gammaproteobacteria bacterium]
MNNWLSLSITELHENLDKWLLVDIRDPRSFEQGHIPGAINLNNNNLQSYIDENDFETPIVVVCYVGNSSQGAADLLSSVGFQTVYSLSGGMSMWRTQYPDKVE